MRPDKKTGRELARVEPREITVTPAKAPTTNIRQRFSKAISTLLGRSEASTPQINIGNDPRLQTYPGISGEFEANIRRILKARTNDAGEIDDVHALATDVANLLCSLVIKMKTVRRMTSEDHEEVFLALKTIVIEQTRSVFDEQTRRDFIKQLDKSVTYAAAKRGLY